MLGESNSESSTALQKDLVIPPILSLEWNEAPTTNIPDSIRDRMTMFLNDKLVPITTQALGLLSMELLVNVSKDIGYANYGKALHEQTPYASEPTIRALKLFPDKLEVTLTSKEGYGGQSVDVTILKLDDLQQATGQISDRLASQHPEIVKTLLTEPSASERYKAAKLALMRFLVSEKPEYTSGLNVSLVPSMAIAYSIDGKLALVKQHIPDLPHLDPAIGESVVFYDALKKYEDVLLELNRSEFDNMTERKIADYLTSLPKWMQSIAVGDYNQVNAKANRIFRFIQSVTGTKGNIHQQRVDKSGRMSSAIFSVLDTIRAGIITSILKDILPEEAGINGNQIDIAFRNKYKMRNQRTLPADFSITQAVLSETLLDELPL